MEKFSRLAASLERAGFKREHKELLAQAENRYAQPRHRHFDDWQRCIESLPDMTPSFIDLDRTAPVIGRAADGTGEQGALLRQGLQALCPWRKGPFDVFGIDIDAEWRSDWKWARIAPHLGSLRNCNVLDIGCGNGYYAMRMQGLGARLVLGLEPTWIHVFQFLALHQYLPAPQRTFVLPLRLEEVPEDLSGFDLAFSMGVLYHCREPRDHLARVFGVLQAGGRMLLGDADLEDQGPERPVPCWSAIQMKNVWVIPSLHPWKPGLVEAVFVTSGVLDQSRNDRTGTASDGLDGGHSRCIAGPEYSGLTIEGYPAPLRACIVAEKPA